MARSMSDTVRGALGNAARETLKNVGGPHPGQVEGRSALGPKGVAAGVGLVAAVPLARKGVNAVRAGRPS